MTDLVSTERLGFEGPACRDRVGERAIQARAGRFLCRTGLATLACAMMAQPAIGQSAEPPQAPATPADKAVVPDVVAKTQPAAAPDEKAITVTGTRITNGFHAPTPTTVIGQEQLNANAEPNVFTTVTQLPSLQGSSGTTTLTYSTSSGQQGLSAFSLRGLGTIRTLTLIDGQRVVGAYYNGTPDVSLFPQLLIKRVDVVNGGASASYGSDAIGGVVNFITDTHFEGVKGNVQGGISKYHDDKQGLFQIAAGDKFMGGRLHVVGSAEYAKEDGVGPGPFGLGLAGGRDWFKGTTLINRNVTNDGLPQYVVRDYGQPYNYTRYGVISAGPLQGIAFDANGNPFQFNYGSNGVPAKNSSGTVIGCYPGFCVGGDLSGNVDSGRTLQSAIERLTGYGRVGFDITPDDEIYVSYSAGDVKTHNQPVNGQQRPNLTIQCANPFVPASIQDLCAANGITSFRYGTSDYILPNTLVHTDRREFRLVVGAKGSFHLGNDWTYDAYYERGVNHTAVDVSNISLSPRFLRAIDATMLDGVIVCADPVARANGCQPIDILSGATPSAAALAYVQPEHGPFQRLRMTQDVASINFSGTPVDLWAGPLSVAFGAEWRKEFYTVRADPYGAGVSDLSPNSTDYPADPVLNSTTGSNWYAGNYKNGHGTFSVKEAYLELNLPLFDSRAAGRANLNGAARLTDYSTYGRNWTWKIGGTWDTPIQGLRLRGVTSKDFRAPNLSELFAAPVTTTLPNFLDPTRNVNVVAIQSVVGNPNLKPEIGRSTELGAVLSGVPWLPGFGLSFDYYTIKVKGVVSSLSAAQIVDFCYRNIIPATCGSYNLNNQNGPNYINVQPFNLASIKTRGFDIEGSYRWQRPLGMPGSLTVRALATHVIDFITDTGLPGTVPVDSAGDNTGVTPKWKWLAIQSYANDRFSFNVQERWFTDGTIGNQYIVCQSNCPVSTAAHPTIDNNFMPGAFYLDLGASVNLTKNITAYAKVDNVFDHSPAKSPFYANPALYDIVGRIYRAGVRFGF